MHYTFTINIEPRTKKNHSQVVMRGKHPILIPSAAYTRYLKEFNIQVKPIQADASHGLAFPLDGFYNVSAQYYMGARRRIDISNLHSALHDALVSSGVLVDDDCLHIGSTDGSFVQYDKYNPRTIITLTDCTYDKAWMKKEDSTA